MAIQQAVISVYDKTGIVEFARRLTGVGMRLVSTGGTAKLLREAGLPVRDVSELTGWPEMLGSRVKTLHPKVHGGLLFRRNNAEDCRQAAESGIEPIDLVVVNLYPFEAVAAREGVGAEELIENIDIGGPAMIRSAAKNFQGVAVVTDPADYSWIADEIARSGDCRLETRLLLAAKAFALTARYDGTIATEFGRLACQPEAVELGHVVLQEKPLLPKRLHPALKLHCGLRYGENPHQKAGLYVPAGAKVIGLAGAQQLQGKELSYNNLVDLDAAWKLVQEFSKPAAAIIKHNNPCGTAEQGSLLEAYRKAVACDPVSAFGGVIAFNQALDAATAEEVAKLFVECIVAPGFETKALEKLTTKRNLRLLEIEAEPVAPDSRGAIEQLELKRVSGGVLVQTPDRAPTQEAEWKVVTERQPSNEEMAALRFAWKVARHVKSNAIVFAREGRTLGIGAGQMSRVDSVKLAVMKASAAGHSLQGSAVGSDAFFPFPDGVEEAAQAGARAVIQPGGSVRDAEVIAAANKLGAAMVFTGMRHFLH